MLKEVIQRAIDNGWDTTHFSTPKVNYKHPEDSEFHDPFGEWHSISPYDIVFNHNFAKALWGEPRPTIEHSGKATSFDFNKGWQYHLQHMVISENPIKYAYDNTKGKE